MHTHPLVEKVLRCKGPVIHAQTIAEDHSLPGVGHHILYANEVVAEELLHPVDFYLELYLLYVQRTLLVETRIELWCVCEFTVDTKGETFYHIDT